MHLSLWILVFRKPKASARRLRSEKKMSLGVTNTRFKADSCSQKCQFVSGSSILVHSIYAYFATLRSGSKPLYAFNAKKTACTEYRSTASVVSDSKK